MAKNEFLPFGIAEGANVLSNQEYERLAARFNGFVSGVAKSQELNTVWRQSSVISSAVAQFIVDSDNKDLLDNGDVAGIKNRLIAAIKQIISGVGYVTTAAMNLELNKKVDKASISGVKGNDNDKVPSLNLFTGEIGKLQPKGDYVLAGYSYSKTESDGKYQLKGNYAPAGDYATNTALNNGLALKFDKTSVTQSAGVSTTQVMSQDAATKAFLRKGEFGFGGFGADRSFTEAETIAFLKDRATVSQIFRNSNATTSTSYQYAPIFYFKSANTWGAITADIFGGGIKVSAGDDERANTYEIWSKRTAIEDRNGYLHSSVTTEEMQSVPIGASLIWNSEAPIPVNFWPNEGRSFSASEYPELAKIFPTLKLPDDRGYAIRVADNGKNIDAGRKVGTYQEDQIQNIIGSIGFVKGIEGATATGAFSANVKSIESSGHAGSSFGQGGSYDFDAGRVVRTGTETRMKNVAKILITRVK